MNVRRLVLAICLGCGSMVVLLSLLASPTPIAYADPSTYYVREGGTDTDCITFTAPCGSIQQAIDLATAPDDEVWIAAGVYTENLAITHSVRLRGAWNVSFAVQSPVTYQTVVDGSGEHNVFIEEALPSEVVLEYLTLRNGKDGLHIESGDVTVERCVILDADKQGFEIDGGAVTISATQILTAKQAIEVDGGVIQVVGAHLAHTSNEGLFIEKGGIVTFTDGIIEDCGQEGVHVEEGSLWLFDNHIHHVISDGVRIEPNASASIISNVISAVLEDPDGDYHGIQIEGDQLVKDNLITDVDDRGICARYGASTILNNVIYDTGGDGIRAAATSTDVEIRGNAVYGAGNDGIDARGSRVIVSRNTVTGCADNGIKVDSVSDWAYIDANTGLSNSVGIAIRDVPAFTFTNNIVGDSITASVELDSEEMGHLYHNTLVGSGVGVHGTGMVILSPLTATLANNIIVSHTVGITATPGASLVVSRTLLRGNSSDPITSTGVITQAPLFVAPASQNYHLQENSPAVDAGIELGVSRDVDGDPRLSLPDVGADEIVEKAYLPLVIRSYEGG